MHDCVCDLHDCFFFTVSWKVINIEYYLWFQCFLASNLYISSQSKKIVPKEAKGSSFLCHQATCKLKSGLEHLCEWSGEIDFQSFGEAFLKTPRWSELHIFTLFLCEETQTLNLHVCRSGLTALFAHKLWSWMPWTCTSGATDREKSQWTECLGPLHLFYMCY